MKKPHTEKEFIPWFLVLANLCIERRMEFLGDMYPNNATTHEIIEAAYLCEEFQKWLRPADKLLTKSAKREKSAKPGIVVWVRSILNLNSNKSLRKRGFVEPGAWVENHGYLLTDYGLSFRGLSVNEVRQRLESDEKPRQQKLLGVIRRLAPPTKPDVKVVEKNATKKTTWKKTPDDVIQAVQNRSEGYCETCLDKLAAQDDGGYCCDGHHMFDENSKDENVLPKDRYSHDRHLICVCPTCHRILHCGVGHAELNYAAAKKITTLHNLSDAGATDDEIREVRARKII